jgi:hypothetical protein
VRERPSEREPSSPFDVGSISRCLRASTSPIVAVCTAARSQERKMSEGVGQRVDTRTLMSSMVVVPSSAQWRLRRPSVSGGWWRSDGGRDHVQLGFQYHCVTAMADSSHGVEWGVVAGHGGSDERLVPASGAGVDLLRSRG